MAYKDKDKQREYQRNWVKARRDFWLSENGPCATCGSRIDLEVDHLDPDTKVTHRVFSWTKEKRDKELAKCQVLCSRCHMDKSISDWGKSPSEHGRCLMYRRGCRCRPCKDAKSDYRKKYNSTKSK